MKSENEKYCTECGEVINKKAEICPKCGVRQPEIKTPPSPEEEAQKKAQERWIITLVLMVILAPMGLFGIHRMYNKQVLLGVIQLLTLGGCGIWWLIDLIMLITGNLPGPDGEKLKAPW